MDSSTYEPAWAYQRGGNWSAETSVAWIPTKHGDELHLWLPRGVIGINVPDAAAAEALAWQEARNGPLPRTWTSGPQKDNGTYGTRIYGTWPGEFRGTVTTGVTVEKHLKVWPSKAGEDGDRYGWYDESGIVLLGSPDGPAGLPSPWRDALLTHDYPFGYTQPTLDDTLTRFLAETFVQTDSQAHRLTTDEIYSTFEKWVDVMDVPAVWRVKKIHLGRWLSTSARYRAWAGRTQHGYRRGFSGLRFPDGAWNA